MEWKTEKMPQRHLSQDQSAALQEVLSPVLAYDLGLCLFTAGWRDARTRSLLSFWDTAKELAFFHIFSGLGQGYLSAFSVTVIL